MIVARWIFDFIIVRFMHSLLGPLPELRLPRSACTSAPRTESDTLSMRRVAPTRAASASSTSPSRTVDGREVVRGRAPRRIRARRAGSVATSPRTRSTSARRVALARDDGVGRGFERARQARARRARSSGERYALRLDSARPSGSRTIGQPTTSTGRSRSAAMRAITASCCASLRPKYAAARTGDREQLGDDGRDAVEVRRAGRAAQIGR